MTNKNDLTVEEAIIELNRYQYSGDLIDEPTIIEAEVK